MVPAKYNPFISERGYFFVSGRAINNKAPFVPTAQRELCYKTDYFVKYSLAKIANPRTVSIQANSKGNQLPFSRSVQMSLPGGVTQLSTRFSLETVQMGIAQTLPKRARKPPINVRFILLAPYNCKRNYAISFIIW